MRNSEGHTPKEAVAAMILKHIKNMHEGYTNDVEDSGPPSFQREVKKHLVGLYKVILDNSGLDGLPLN